MTARIYDDVSRLLDDFHSELEKKAGNGLAAVGVKYRDKILSNQRSTAICAYAIKVAIESRGGRSSGPGWESFYELAEQAQRPSKDRKLEEEQRRMRALAVLWAQWSWATVTHYKWELHSPKLLTQLGKLATQFPQWPEFIRNLNYFMLSRHERSLSGGRTQPIGRHHASSRVQDESSPLEACDVDCLLKRPPSDIELQTFSDRLKHWTQGTYRHLKVHGKRLSDYPNIRHFRVRVDQYGMLVRHPDSLTIDPRNRRSSHAQSTSITKDGFMSWDQGDIAFSEETGNHTTEKDHQEEWVEPAEESILKIRKPRSPAHQELEPSYGQVGGMLSLSDEALELPTSVSIASPMRSSEALPAQSSSRLQSLRFRRESDSLHGLQTNVAQQIGYETPQSIRYHFDAACRSQSDPSSSKKSLASVTSRASTPFEDNAAWNLTQASSPPPAFAMSTSSFSSMIDYSQCPDAPNDSQYENCHMRAQTSPVSFDASTPIEPPLPTPRAMSLSTGAVSSVATSSHPLSSTTNFKPNGDGTSDSHLADESLVSRTLPSTETMLTADMQTPQNGTSAVRRSNENCSVCNGACIVAQVPTHVDQNVRNLMFEFAHYSYSLAKTAPDEETRNWIQTRTFVTYIEPQRGIREYYLLAQEHSAEFNYIPGKAVLTWSSLSNKSPDETIQTRPVRHGPRRDVRRRPPSQQVRNEIMQRRRKKRGLRYGLLQKFKSQVHKVETISRQLVDAGRHGHDDHDGTMQNDVHEEVRQAEQHMLSTAEVVDEVYDDSATDGPTPVGQVREEGSDGGGRKRDLTTAEDLQNTTIVGVGDRWTEMSEPGSTDDPVPSGTARSLRADDDRVQPKPPQGSWHGKRRAVHDAADILSVADGNALAEIETHVSNAEPDASAVGMDQTQHLVDPPLSINCDLSVHFPKSNDEAASAKMCSNITLSPDATARPWASGRLHEHFPFTKVLAEIDDPANIRSRNSGTELISKKRKLPDQSGSTEGKLRLTDPKHAQRKSWEPLKETVNSIRRIWSELDHAKIYVTSGVDLEELAAQQHPIHQRLWSWSKDDKEGYQHQISRLLRNKKFGFQVVCSDVHTRQYCTLDYMDFWNAYFEDSKLNYWLAILTPWRRPAEPKQKLRRVALT